MPDNTLLAVFARFAYLPVREVILCVIRGLITNLGVVRDIGKDVVAALRIQRFVPM